MAMTQQHTTDKAALTLLTSAAGLRGLLESVHEAWAECNGPARVKICDAVMLIERAAKKLEKAAATRETLP